MVSRDNLKDLGASSLPKRFVLISQRLSGHLMLVLLDSYDDYDQTNFDLCVMIRLISGRRWERSFNLISSSLPSPTLSESVSLFIFLPKDDT